MSVPSGPTFPAGLIVVSLADGYYRHLYVWHPVYLSLTRLANHPWDDMQPAISPDGTRLAYTSRRNGFWDIYIYDLASDQSIRVTDSPAYDGNPTWSPDGNWLAYDSYRSGNLDIFIQSVADLTQPPVQLTFDPAGDFDPSWSPTANILAFTSLRTGESEIWLAHLDQTDDQLVDFSQNPASADSQPAWSPDGQSLAWTSETNGSRMVMVSPADMDAFQPRTLGAGAAPLWNPTGDEILAEVAGAEGTSWAGYNPHSGLLTLPPMPLPSQLYGAAWKNGSFPDLIKARLEPNAGGPASPLLIIPTAQSIDPVTGRTGLVPLTNVTAPYPFLSDTADEAFSSLRSEIARLSGWDVLANLQNAYLPISAPSLSPDSEDWLRTGLAIAINPLPYQAGWMAVQREDLGGEVYWRLYIQARFQDGSQGEPIAGMVWDLNARSSGQPENYEQGGTYTSPPAGYWIDFTELAARFGWQRLPALANWRTFFSAALFNEFVFSQGMKWNTAMRQLYPAEMVNTPPAYSTITPTPTSTALPLNGLTATARADSRQLPTTVSQPRPTWTPLPGAGFP